MRHSVAEQPFDDKKAIRYLLNDLPEDDQALFEESYISDPQIFEHMRAVEEELIEDYLQERLSGPDRELFERHYLSTPQRREKVLFSRDLIEALELEADEEDQIVSIPGDALSSGTESHETGARPWWRSLLAFLAGHERIIGFAVAVLIILGGSWLALELVHLSQQLSRAQQELAVLKQRERELQQQVIEQRGRSDNLAKELSQERSQRNPQKPEISLPQHPKSSVVAFTLSTGIRDLGKSERLIIPPHATRVQLRINLTENGYSTYHASLLRVSGGGEIWNGRGIKTRAGKTVMVNIPARIFNTTGIKDYILILNGKTAEGVLEEVNRYYFHISR